MGSISVFNVVLCSLGIEKKNNVGYNIYASKTSKEWIKELSSGVAGLLCTSFSLFSNQEDPVAGFMVTKDWEEAAERNEAHRIGYVSHLSSHSDARLYTLQCAPPEGTALANIMGTITEVLQGCDNETYRTSVPQLFLNGDGGFSNMYTHDNFQPVYRVFLYLGSGEDSCYVTGSECHYAFVTVAGSDEMHILDMIPPKQCIKHLAFYTEGKRSFRMHAGDVLIIKGEQAFTVNLPLEVRAPDARMLSWCVYHVRSLTSEQQKDGIVKIPENGFEEMLPVQMYTDRNKRALQLFMSENIDASTMPIMESESWERKRVTPKEYEEGNIRAMVEGRDRITGVATLRFWDSDVPVTFDVFPGEVDPNALPKRGNSEEGSSDPSDDIRIGKRAKVSRRYVETDDEVEPLFIGKK